ncbi:MAG: FG-GAP-like repeat-containing protein [Planctomycetota bacterium]
MVLLVSLVLAACGDEPRGTGGENQPPASPPAASAAKPAPGAPIAFRDIRAQSGIAWKHTFLDSESGTSYKLNPYDHGSGVLIADANGDGHDDLLLLNFVGTNGLYLGQGNGTFKDQTEKSGLAMPRSINVGGCFGDYAMTMASRPARVHQSRAVRLPATAATRHREGT